MLPTDIVTKLLIINVIIILIIPRQCYDAVIMAEPLREFIGFI